MEEINKLQSDPLERECFLNGFPQLNEELKWQIRSLCEFADKVDKVHRKCTITKNVAHSIGATSGVLTVLGLAWPL